MKNLFLCITCLFVFNGFGQKFNKSAAFEEPEGWVKLLQLKNGNTFFIEYTKKEGINTRIFDGNRKKTAEGKLALTLIEDKLGMYNISGIFEIAGDVALFYQTSEKYTPIMIRIIIDGKTGKVKAEEKIAELQKLTMKDGYAYAFGGVDMPDIFVSKDPDSDYYAVVRYNTFAPETKDRIEVLHYNPQHKIINKANYTAPNNKYKYTKYLSAYVHKDDYVVIGTYAYNTDKTGGDEASFYVSQLAKGKTNFTQKELAYHDFWKGARCNFTYNSIKNSINMVINTDVDVKGSDVKYDIVYQNINPTTLQLDKPYKVDFTTVNDYFKNIMLRKNNYAGLIHGASVDKDGNFIILYQETTLKYGNGQGIAGTFLGDVALVTMSPEGKVVNTAVFPVNIYASGKHAFFNCNAIKNGLKSELNNWQDGGLANQQYFALDLVTTDNAEYVFFNNMPINMTLDISKEPKLVKAISTATAVKYTLKKGDVKKEYLFGEPKDKKDNEFCNFGCSDYNKETKTYATLVTDPKTKKTSVLWLKLD